MHATVTRTVLIDTTTTCETPTRPYGTQSRYMRLISQTKNNFGPRAKPFGARLSFSEEEITIEERSLDDTALAQEKTLSAADRVLHVLKGGSAFPADIAERSGVPLGTVKNVLTDLRERGLVEYTGKTDAQTRAKEVRLSEDGRAVMDVTNI